MVKMDPPKLVPSRTFSSFFFDTSLPPYCIIWSPSQKFGPPLRDEVMLIPEHISVSKFGPVAYLGGFLGLCNTQFTVTSFPARCVAFKFCNKRSNLASPL